MRVYQFMSAAHGLDNLRKRRLKVSFLEDMNDPFELLATTLESAQHRTAFRGWKQYMNATCRVLCFSKSWSNPVIWSHYADKHRGVCLGFDVPDELLLPISYTASRIEAQLEKHLKADGTVTPAFSRKLLTTKFEDWKYEDEVRMFLKPEECYEELGLHFFPFGENLAPKEIVLGARCTASEREAKSAVKASEHRISVTPTRLAFKTFRVIQKPLPLVPRRR